MDAIWFHTSDVVDGGRPLWSLETTDGRTIAEQIDRPTLPQCRDVADEFGVDVDAVPVYRFAAMGDLL